MCSSRVVIVTIVAWVLSGLFAVEGAAAPASSSQPQEVAVHSRRPDSGDQLAARKATVQARLDALGAPGAEQDAQGDLRAVLEQTLSTLTLLEQQLQRRTRYQIQLTELPQRLRDAETQQRELTRTPIRHFATVDEQLRGEYQIRLQNTLNDIQTIIKETVDGEVRLANIPRELAEHAQQQAQYEETLLAIRSEPTETVLTQARLDLVELQIEWHRREGEVLASEREWLLKRVPLQDELLRLAQARHQRFQQELDTITAALGQEIAAEQATLNATAADITQKMQQALNPVEALQLRVGLETVEIRRQTADARRRLNELSELVLSQKRKAAHTKQISDRLSALIEKYAVGEATGQRLLVLFDRLQRERVQYDAAAVVPLAQEIRTLNEQLFSLEDTLYEFDYTTDQRLAELTPALAKDAPTQSSTEQRSLRLLFDEQKNALHDRQQVLAALIQELTRLLTLNQEYTRQLDETQVFALTTLFWIRNNAPLSIESVRDAVAGGVQSVQRGAVFVQEEWQRGQEFLRSGLGAWGVALVALVIAPWVAYRSDRQLRTRIGSLLSNSAEQKKLPGWAVTALVVIRSLIWPLYLLFLSWLYTVKHPNGQAQESPPLVLTVQFVALLLWLGLLGRAVFRRKGWAYHYWQLPPDVCRSFARAVLIVIGAAFLFLVPRFLLLLTPGSGEYSEDSHALARLLFLLFQIVVMGLIGVIGRQGSPLAEVMRGGERQEKSVLWRLWPTVYLILLTVLVVLIGLDMAGYSYASQFLWFRTFSSLAVIFLVRLLFVHGLPRLVNTGVQVVVGAFRRNLPQDEPQREASRSFALAFLLLGRGLLSLAAVLVLLEVWGLPVQWVLMSPALWQMIKRGGIIALTVGITLVVIRTSSFITNSLLAPPTGGKGREIGRKLKTLAPLVQTLIRVGVVFAATLVVLEQLGIATGPVLAGAGIFGLAVGFASQSLIKDFINGLFILFEDSLSVGDVVKVRGTEGQVEKFTLRAVTLRDLTGNVHVIPNSVIDMVTNMSKDYSRYVLDVGVASRENIEAAIALLGEIDEGMRHDADYGRDLLEPLEILGVERFDDSVVMIRARLKTRPIQQWRIGREFHRRIKQVFDERGVGIARSGQFTG